MGLLDPITSEAERYRRLITGPDIGVTPEEIEEEKRKKRQGLLSIAASRDETEDNFEAPVDPGKDFGEYMASQGGVSGFFGSVLKPKLSKMIFRDDLKDFRQAQAGYATEKALFDIEQAGREQEAKNSAGDAQNEAVSNYIRAVRDGKAEWNPMTWAALSGEAGGWSAFNPNGYTVSPGQSRRDAFGNEVASGGDPVINPTAVMQNARETAKGYGIPVGSQAYADLIAAYAEPSGSRDLGDGTFVPYNTVDKVIADWESGSYDKNQQAAAGQPAGGSSDLGVTPGGGVTPEGARGATVRGVMNKEIAENLKIADQKISFYNDLEGVISNFGEWDPDANDGEGAFVANEATRDNYGSIQNHRLYPGRYEMFKGDDEKDSLVFMDQLVDMLTVDERGKLKGQGQITEGETAMLKRAVTTLQNRNLSDEAMQRELAKLMRGLIARREKFIDLQGKYGSDGQGGNTATDFDTMWENS